jgi:UDP-N-acetylmuramoylalanine--D-glutamate ligase
MTDCLSRCIRKGDTILVVGLGKSGLSAVRFFLQQGATVKLSDSRHDHPQASLDWLGSVGVEVELGGHSQEFCGGVDLVLISPGVPHRLPILEFARSQGIPVCGELALAPHYLKTPVIAITGTNGKTTTTTLAGEIVKASGKKVFVGGNIGTPLTDYLIGDQAADWLVLEISSFQLDAAGEFRPDIGVILNVTPDHLDRYEGMDAYARSKFNLFKHQGGNDVAIYNSDDSVLGVLFQEAINLRNEGRQGRIIPFGQTVQGAEWAQYSAAGVKCAVNGAMYDFDLSHSIFADFPNRENAAAAIVGGLVAGCAPAAIADGIAKFIPLAHRMTFVGEFNGVRFYNDSKATNVGAVEAALKGFIKPVILIAGGRNKGGDFVNLQASVAEKVKYMLLIGEAREFMAEHFNTLTKVELQSSLLEAVARACEVAAPGDVVLFSPACASFDMFSSYAHRGEVFEQLVNELAA